MVHSAAQKAHTDTEKPSRHSLGGEGDASGEDGVLASSDRCSEEIMELRKQARKVPPLRSPARCGFAIRLRSMGKAPTSKKASLAPESDFH